MSVLQKGREASCELRPPTNAKAIVFDMHEPAFGAGILLVCPFLNRGCRSAEHAAKLCYRALAGLTRPTSLRLFKVKTHLLLRLRIDFDMSVDIPTIHRTTGKDRGSTLPVGQSLLPLRIR